MTVYGGAHARAALAEEQLRNAGEQQGELRFYAFGSTAVALQCAFAIKELVELRATPDHAGDVYEVRPSPRTLLLPNRARFVLSLDEDPGLRYLRCCAGIAA